MSNLLDEIKEEARRRPFRLSAVRFTRAKAELAEKNQIFVRPDFIGRPLHAWAVYICGEAI